MSVIRWKRAILGSLSVICGFILLVFFPDLPITDASPIMLIAGFVVFSFAFPREWFGIVPVQQQQNQYRTLLEQALKELEYYALLSLNDTNSPLSPNNNDVCRNIRKVLWPEN
jgi:hypothetical protein